MAKDSKMFGANALRGEGPTSSSGRCVEDTMQLKGEAKDSLSDTNTIKQYEIAAGEKGTLGAKSESN